MRLMIFALTGFLVLISLGIGGAYFVLGIEFLVLAGGFSFVALDGQIEYAAIDNTLRFMAGLWIMLGVGLAYCLRDLEARGAILTTLLLGFVLGGVGRLLSAFQFGMPEAMIVPTVIEFVIPPIILLLNARISKTLRVRA
ncbi:DUF4345 domain-containing protein [Tateyamaria sp. SN6-1]|uniref:DUF4345 domain-containing protein n=1 Tax=Tateyamaria sp. SN6-1 TaxID=3092148 RepID=UPI0039F53A1F